MRVSAENAGLPRPGAVGPVRARGGSPPGAGHAGRRPGRVGAAGVRGAAGEGTKRDERAQDAGRWRARVLRPFVPAGLGARPAGGSADGAPRLRGGGALAGTRAPKGFPPPLYVSVGLGLVNF